jgi:tripartite-type tricarboxylate transporter receptor subunit TctC
VRLFALAGVMMLAGAASGQHYPDKPIRLIVPYAPGGSTDLLARIIGPKLTESWGQPVIVDNRPGGNTVIGTEAAARSAPDGYTVLLFSTTQAVLPSLNPNLPYDITKDFVGVAALSSTPNVLVDHPSVPAHTLREFIALAKARPGQLSYGTSGIGGAVHLASELFNITAGTKMHHIPYKGSGPVVTDLIGGQIHLSFQTPVSVIPHVRSGRLRAIAVAGENRLSALPRVPTFAEGGLPSYDYKAWFGILAPTGTPRDVIDKMSAELTKIVNMPDTREKLINQGMEPFVLAPDQVTALIKADVAKYAKVVKTANIRVEQ